MFITNIYRLRSPLKMLLPVIKRIKRFLIKDIFRIYTYSSIKKIKTKNKGQCSSFYSTVHSIYDFLALSMRLPHKVFLYVNQVTKCRLMLC